ncbi:hypothetical protein FEM48_Zijuj07G0157900 [Ziziphus jujuba var. spinosa]|uniref:Disease resistance protein At4g27190-like leucine-rich repeats domain-containing protein n=1 Tax=Ziziphus jujuba var. spinosa TaxID=714518 RepID=A0A978V5I5_ZIZJJ|nr:hypothetical protein FEM48_Zijuj07G0157900 [Ziziphus jujuba var. spinosa]
MKQFCPSLKYEDLLVPHSCLFNEKATFPTLQKLSLARIVSLDKIWDGQYEGLVGEEEHRGILLSHIRELKLSDLPNLMNLWEESTHPCTAYKNLDILEVLRCVSLPNLVPSLVSFRNLVNLRVSMECLTSFYSGNYMMKFPNLEEVVLRQCPEMRTFSSEWSSHHVDNITAIEDINSVMLQHWDCNQNDVALQQPFAEKDDEQIYEEHSEGNFEEVEDFMSAG